jgi:NAD(P)H-nitrite reductase large subunit
MHRRTDSDVSVQGLATMFEGLEVKDPREAALRYKVMLEKEKQKWIEKLNRHDKEHAASMERKALRIEELESELAQARTNLQSGVSRDQYEKEWKANKANIKKWEQVFKDREEQWKCDSSEQ